MANKNLPLVGIVDQKLCSFDDYQKIRARILKIITKAAKNENIDFDDFFKILEAAIRTALICQKFEKQRRSIVRAEIEQMRGAKTAEELLSKSPRDIRGLVANQIDLTKATSERDFNIIARQFAERADNDLIGRGRDKDIISINLAAEIADAFKRIGIKPVVSRPAYFDKPYPYYQVVQICLRYCRLPYKDPYRHMKDATKVTIHR